MTFSIEILLFIYFGHWQKEYIEQYHLFDNLKFCIELKLRFLEEYITKAELEQYRQSTGKTE